MNKTILCLLLFCITHISLSSNVTITNVSLENFNESEGWIQIQCDITWLNSWRIDSGPSNWDAVWVFAKYRANSGPWTHVALAPLHSSVPTGFNIDVSNDNKGAFIYRTDVGSGTSAVPNTLLGWDLNVNHIDINSTIEVQVFAIEMVYVPQSSFNLGRGSGGSETDGFSSTYITNENERTVTYTTTSSYAGDGIGLLPTAFPKGYNAFYCMKYEISEGQYVAFFNNIDENDRGGRDLSGLSFKDTDDELNGNTFAWLGPGTDATTTVPERACSYINYVCLKAYLGWAALRPMTELEYEKAARGPGAAVAETYAWGTPFIKDAPYTLWSGTINTYNEYISGFGAPFASNYGSAAYSLTSTNFPRPLRCGIFSWNNNTSPGAREMAGASYYGIMELSGNLAELTLSAGNSADREYTGEHGAGYAYTYYQFGSSVLAGIRGGGWQSNPELLRIADRTYGGTLSYAGILPSLGGRGVRTAD